MRLVTNDDQETREIDDGKKVLRCFTLYWYMHRVLCFNFRAQCYFYAYGTVVLVPGRI